MDTETVTTFLALLSLLCWLGTLGTIALFALRRSGDTAAGLLDDVGTAALPLAAVVAATSMLGSLYLSEVAHFVPCELCWFQRICMYPLALILTIAAFRRDRSVWVYTAPVAGIGAAIAVYHTQLTAFPDQANFCSTTLPCSTRYVWEFGFVSIPFMALAGFVFIITMVATAAYTAPHHNDEVTSQ